MKLIINMIIMIIITLASITIIFKILEGVYDIEEEIRSSEIKYILETPSSLLITGEFFLENRCNINHFDSSSTLINLTETDLKKTFNYRFSVSTGHIFKIDCCNIKNQCINESYVVG